MEKMEDRAFLYDRSHICMEWKGGTNKRRGLTHHDLVLPREVGGLAEELCLRHSDSTWGLSNQHCVVEFGTSRGRRAEVFAL